MTTTLAPVQTHPSPPDPFIEVAWLSFILWASAEESLISKFQEETGKSIITANIETMKAFVVWVTENYWGADEDCPAIYFEKFKAVKP